MASKNLWGDLAELPTVRTPRTILLEQAQYLSEATNGKLIGHVADLNQLLGTPLYNMMSGRKTSEKMFLFEFRIKVPALNNYSYTLFSVEYGIDLYPTNIYVGDGEEPIVCHNGEKIEIELEKLFKSNYVKDILSKLLSQV